MLLFIVIQFVARYSGVLIMGKQTNRHGATDQNKALFLQTVTVGHTNADSVGTLAWL